MTAAGTVITQEEKHEPLGPLLTMHKEVASLDKQCLTRRSMHGAEHMQIGCSVIASCLSTELFVNFHRSFLVAMH